MGQNNENLFMRQYEQTFEKHLNKNQNKNYHLKMLDKISNSSP